MTDLLTRTFPYDGGRAVSVHLPARRAEALVIAGDGQLIAPWGARLEEAGTIPTAVVGVHRTGSEDEMVRIREYSPSFDPAIFAAHERLVVEDVLAWVREDLGIAPPPARTAVLGVSAGGELALALGLRHPDLFGAILCASPGGGYRPPEALLPAPIPRTYLLAGTEEPFFAENADRWADALRAAGADVRSVRRAGGHGDPSGSRSSRSWSDGPSGTSRSQDAEEPACPVVTGNAGSVCPFGERISLSPAGSAHRS